MTLAVSTTDLTFEYAPSTGAVGIDMEVRAGTVYGFLGPNGAGKSTVIRMLTALIKPQRGTSQVLGLDPWSAQTALHRRIGVLLSEQPIPRHHTGGSLLRLLSELRGLPDVIVHGHEIAERLGLDLAKRGHELSRGNQQKLGLVTALAHQPELVILDEPTNGLDPLLQRELAALLREIAADGRTVLLSSHSLPDVEMVADDVGFIRDAELVEQVPLAALADRAVRRVTLTFATAVTATDFDRLSSVERVELLSEQTISVWYRGPAAPVLLRAGELGALTIDAQPVELDGVFLALYRGDQ